MLPEIAIMKMLGASNKQIIFNTIYQLQIKAFIASIIGLSFGVLLTNILPTFQNIQLLGFVIHPVFSISMIGLSLFVINGIILVVLVKTLLSLDWNQPFELIREKSINLSRI